MEIPYFFLDTHFNASTTEAFENTVGKEGNEQFLLFSQCFLLNQKILSLFVSIFYIISSFAVDVEVRKFGT